MSAYDDLARILAERDLDVGDLIRQAEDDARADVAETLLVASLTTCGGVLAIGWADVPLSRSRASPTACGRSCSSSPPAISTTKPASSGWCAPTTSSC